MTALDELKRRKVVQWALTCLAGAWVALQLVAMLAGPFGWPGWIQRGATILRAYVDAGGRDAYAIQRSPLFSRVRGESAFRAELAELERVVERQRREVEREGV